MNNELLDDFNYQEENIYPSFKNRLLAAFLDATIIGIIAAFLMTLYNIGVFILDFNPSASILSIIFKSMFIITSMLYFLILERRKYQASLGKLFFKIKVINKNGEQISSRQAWGRYLTKILPLIFMFSNFIGTAVIILMLNCLMAAFTEKKQGLHDIIADTYVINSQ